MQSSEPIFCAKRLSRNVSLGSLKLFTPSLYYLQKNTGSSQASGADDNGYRVILSQLAIATLVLTVVILVSQQLHLLAPWLVTGVLFAINIALLISALMARLSGKQQLAARLFAWCTINYVFTSTATVLQLGLVDFIPDSFFYWVVGGAVLSLLAFSRAPLLLTQVALLAWMYSQFLYGTSALFALPVMALCVAIIALGQAWRDQFILLMLNIVILFNLVGYDFIHPQHFPLQLARDHVCWTLSAFLMLGILGVLLQTLPQRKYQNLGTTALFFSCVLLCWALVGLSFDASWQLLSTLTMQQPTGALALLFCTVASSFVALLYARGEHLKQSRRTLQYLTLVAAVLIYCLAESIALSATVPLLLLLLGGIRFCSLGIVHRSSIFLVGGALTILTPVLLRFFTGASTFGTTELAIAFSALALPLILTRPARNTDDFA